MQKRYRVQTYDVAKTPQDTYAEVEADSALAALEQVAGAAVTNAFSHSSIRRHDYWEEIAPDNPEIAAQDNHHAQFTKSGRTGIAAWRIG